MASPYHCFIAHGLYNSNKLSLEISPLCLAAPSPDTFSLSHTHTQTDTHNDHHSSSRESSVIDYVSQHN